MIQFSQPLAINVSWNKGASRSKHTNSSREKHSQEERGKSPGKTEIHPAEKKKCLATWGVYWPTQVEALGTPEGMIAFQMSWNYGSESLAKLAFRCSSRECGNVYNFS